MRLAAITGLAHKLDDFSDSQKIRRPEEPSASRQSDDSNRLHQADWTNGAAAAHMDGTGKRVDRKLRSIWIGSAILLIATIVVVLFS